MIRPNKGYLVWDEEEISSGFLFRANTRPPADSNAAVPALALLPAFGAHSSFRALACKVIRIIGLSPFFP